MSDPLARLWRSFATAWSSPPALSTARVGNGNWLSSQRQQELRELKSFLSRVRKANDACELFSEERLDDAATLVLERACRSADVDNAAWAVEVGYEPIQTLLHYEFRALPELTEGGWRELSLRDKSQIRCFLQRRATALADPARKLDLACTTLEDLFTKLLKASSAIPSEPTPGQLTLSASALEWMQDAPGLIELCWGSFFLENLAAADLFEDLREQLRRNTLFASGIDVTDANAGKKIVRPTSARGRSPRQLVDDYLAHTPLQSFFEADVSISVPDETRFEHTHILGGSGHGKTQLLLHLIHQDLMREEGPGLVVIDSQGDLVRTLSRLELFHPDGELAKRLVIIDPADVEYPVSLGLFDRSAERLHDYTPAERERVLNGAIEMYEYVFSSLLGAELTQKQGVIFRFLARLMMVIPEATLHTLLDLMEHGERFRPHMARLDGMARRFFDEEFFHSSFSATKKQIAKRLWGILANPVFERLFSQPRAKFDFFEALQARKIILISTAKDVLRQEGAEMFGRFLIAKLTQAVMERAAVAPSERAPAYIYIDEAQEYVDDHMAYLLNQARKYRVGLTLAHQNLDQLPTGLRASVMASTSMKLAGGVSAKDATALAEDMHANVEFLQSMAKRRDRTTFACYVRNVTPRAAEISIPLGRVNGLSQLDDAEFSELIRSNRERYCVVVSMREPDPLPAAAEQLPEPRTPSVDSPDAPKQRDKYLAGQGGQQHRYVQHLLRAAAQERGFAVEIEAKAGDHPVDLVIHANGQRIACEVSVATDAKQEASNVSRCLDRGFDAVWVIAPSIRKKSSLAKALAPRFVDVGLRTFTVEEALLELKTIGATDHQSNEHLVRGYRVTVRGKSERPADIERKRKLLASVLSRSRKERD